MLLFFHKLEKKILNARKIISFCGYQVSSRVQSTSFTAPQLKYFGPDNRTLQNLKEREEKGKVYILIMMWI